jgi:hypothetical protein
MLCGDDDENWWKLVGDDASKFFGTKKTVALVALQSIFITNEYSDPPSFFFLKYSCS